MSTAPVVPLTRIRSPSLIFLVADEVPMTAGMANSRASTAACEVRPPASVTRPAILVKRATQAGFVIWQTTMSPLRTWSNCSTVKTTRAMPSMTPGEPPRPSMWLSTLEALRSNFSGKPQLARYGTASWVAVTVPIQSGVRHVDAQLVVLEEHHVVRLLEGAVLDELGSDRHEHEAKVGVGALVDVEVMVGRERRHQQVDVVEPLHLLEAIARQAVKKFLAR